MALTRMSTSLQKTATRYGVFTAVASIVYFLLMKVLGLLEQIQYSFLVGVILSIGICLAIAQYKRQNDLRITYLSGLGVGFATSLVSSVLFGAFVTIYSMFDKTFVTAMQTRDLFGLDLSVAAVCFIGILLQGVMIGSFVGYIAMMYFKSPDHKPGSLTEIE
nr:hypothetical protein [uncultured organism]